MGRLIEFVHINVYLMLLRFTVNKNEMFLYPHYFSFSVHYSHGRVGIEWPKSDIYTNDVICWDRI
jgi:hypothetical protein